MKVYRKARTRDQRLADERDEECGYDGGDDGASVGKIIAVITIIALAIMGVYVAISASHYSFSATTTSTSTTTTNPNPAPINSTCAASIIQAQNPSYSLPGTCPVHE